MATTELERELHDFWCAYEAAIGFRSTFSAMLAAHQGVSLGAGPPGGWDPYAENIDRISNGSRTYRALRRLETGDLVVLYRLYGPRNPSNDHAALGDLSPLAALSDAAHEERDALVLRESTRRSDVAGERVEADVRRRREELEEMFWTEVGVIQQTKDARRADAGWVFLGQILDAHACDGAIRARIGAIESTDREISVDTAIRIKLRERDQVFVDAVKREARAMRTKALEAYRRARADEVQAIKAARKARRDSEICGLKAALGGVT